MCDATQEVLIVKLTTGKKKTVAVSAYSELRFGGIDLKHEAQFPLLSNKYSEKKCN
jgi:hypothetical protein